VRVAIVGSRRFSEPARVAVYVNGLPPRASIVTGGASGVDAAATKAARARGIPVTVMAAGFDEATDQHKSEARRQRLVDACDVLVAFWDGKSKGTRETVDRALDSGKEVHVFLGSAAATMG
jgi:predicted Rossmann fold nucleotide-binding protein DprA/Smf involved in DNA uptake